MESDSQLGASIIYFVGNEIVCWWDVFPTLADSSQLQAQENVCTQEGLGMKRVV